MIIHWKRPIFNELRQKGPDGLGIVRFNGRGAHHEDGAGAPPPTPCEIGTWDFTEFCQSGHILTCGIA